MIQCCRSWFYVSVFISHIINIKCEGRRYKIFCYAGLIEMLQNMEVDDKMTGEMILKYLHEDEATAEIE